MLLVAFNKRELLYHEPS